MTKLRVRARAVDMLGRQQIAGIPTAIHELFKNSHDAYAERVEVDYFRRNRVLVLRDDGYGMTRDDVENRWLTLGTESRVNANRKDLTANAQWRGPKCLPQRSIMGEKGIGRLAIAVIAPLTILLTRAVRPDGLKELVVALVHWGLFEQPGLDINSIDVPIEEFTGGTLPTRETLGRLVDRVRTNLIELKNELSDDAFKSLCKDLDKARLIAPDALDRSLNKDREDPLTLSGNNYGTHFILLPVAPELDDDIDGTSNKESSKLERSLLGFSNMMATDEPVIKTEFRDHTIHETIPRIGSQSFFKNKDFSKTDQYFAGQFDEYGQFVGTVSIFGKQRTFVCNWLDGKGRKPRCGSFSFEYGYVQGRSNESSLSSEDWTEMSGKTEKVGGLYIYRDGIRILPYGNSDVDWLDIEKRRSMSAQDWFFSYRRGFGYVAITNSENSALTEKAGREGFRENLAYRDFRSILMNFFKQLAFEFFRGTAPQGDDYNEGKAANAAQAELLRKQKRKADNRRKNFQKDLNHFFELYNKGHFETRSEEILDTLNEKLEQLAIEAEPGNFAIAARSLEHDAKERVRSLNNEANLALPRGLALSTKLQKDWAAYSAILRQLREELLDPLRREVDDLILKATKNRVAFSERRRFLLQDIEKEKETSVRELSEQRREASKALDLMHKAMREALKEDFSKLRVNFEHYVDEFNKRTAEQPEQLEDIQHEIEQEIALLRSRELEMLDSFKRQIEELTEGVQERETLDDRFAALESRNQVLEEKLEFYSDFAQMGMSVGILQHEFEGAARGIRSAMTELKPWADRNPPLSSIYSKLRNHIEHLDGYLKVLDPLGRRLQRSSVEISGSEILNVIRSVFSEQLDASAITLEPSLEFRSFKVNCKSSALMGAFINLIDNSIYWLNSRAQGKKAIFLDADEDGFLISNNGPGIEAKNKERIFDFGETRKPGGRGMGLAIAREALKGEGFNIELVHFGVDVNPQFKIFSKDGQNE